MYWLIILISILKIGSRRQRQAGRRMRRRSSTPHCTPAVPRGTAAPRFFPPIRGSLMLTKLQSQGVHRTTLVGAERQNSVDFRQGVLGMPLAFEQTPPAPPVPTCLREAHDTRLAHGANNIADEHLADAIEPPSRKPAAAGKK